MFHATEHCSSITNTEETANALIDKYVGRDNVPLMLTVYTNGGLKHNSNFLSVQISMIALQRFLDLGILITMRTALWHCYTNPPEKINFILNLGLNAIGFMRTAIHSNPRFEINILIVLGLRM